MDILNFILDLLIFLGVLSVLVLIHELGHFLAACRGGIKVEEFGWGFPPRLFARKKGETEYSVNALPLGGFVRLYGEEGSVQTGQEQAYYHKGKLTRFLVVAAGVVMNLLLAILAFSIISWQTGVPRSLGEVKLEGVADNSPAAQAGLQKDDVILEIDAERVRETQEVKDLVDQKKGQKILLTIKRGETQFSVEATPRKDDPLNQGALGVLMTTVEFVHPPLPEKLVAVVKQGVKQTIFWGDVTVKAVASVFKEARQGHAPEGVAGPVGIFEIVRSVRREGILSLLALTGILSINLAILNALPIPALDGGRLLFIGVETLFGRRVLPKFERMAHTVGMIVLLILILLVTLSDVRRLLSGGFDFLKTPQ